MLSINQKAMLQAMGVTIYSQPTEDITFDYPWLDDMRAVLATKVHRIEPTSESVPSFSPDEGTLYLPTASSLTDADLKKSIWSLTQ